MKSIYTLGEFFRGHRFEGHVIINRSEKKEFSLDINRYDPLTGTFTAIGDYGKTGTNFFPFSGFVFPEGENTSRIILDKLVSHHCSENLFVVQPVRYEGTLEKKRKGVVLEGKPDFYAGDGVFGFSLKSVPKKNDIYVTRVPLKHLKLPTRDEKVIQQ